MGTTGRLLYVACSLGVPVAGCGRAWFDPPGDAVAGSRRVVLTTDRATLAETLTDFPLLVVLDDTRADRTAMQPDASDLRFSLADGTPLPLEIAQAGAPGGANTLVWVRVPRVDESTTIYLDYGYAAPDPPSESVWNSNYLAVWHLDEMTGARDATGNGHDGVTSGTQATPGVVAGGRSFVATAGDYIRVADAATLDLPALTISAWHLARAAPPYSALVTRQVDDTDYSDFLLATFSQQPVAQITTASLNDIGNPGPSIPLDTWVHIAAAFDGNSVELYVDGVSAMTTPLLGSARHSARPIILGAECSGVCTTPNADFVDGVLDEVRLETGARSAAWLQADVLSARDQLVSYETVR